MLSDSRRGPIIRTAFAVLAFAAVTVVTCLIAHPQMFTGFRGYDDEGYMLTAINGFVEHGHLYDQVFTQYGPFYFEAWGGLFSLFGIPVDHEAGRTVTMCAWVISSLAIGVATARIAGSVLLGLATQMLVFSSLGVLINEPMHPGGIICLLLAAIIAIACFVRDRPSPFAFAVLGAAVAALVLVKINVGAFVVASLALAAAASYPAIFERRWARPLVEVGFVAMPVVLLAGKFGEPWPRRFAAHVAVAALALVIVLRGRRVDRRPNEELGWLVGGFVVLAAVSCLTLLAAGTSLNGLFEGVLRQPLRQADAFTIPLQLDSRIFGFDLVALAGAIAFWHVSRSRSGEPGPAWTALTSLFAIGVGAAMALSVTGKGLPFDAGGLPGYQFTLLSFSWVALLRPTADRRPDVSWALLLLPLIAVPQALHAFPVAGSQTLWATFLLIPVGAICVGNGVRGLLSVVPEGAERQAVAVVGACLVVVIGYFVFQTTLRGPLKAARYGYDAGVPLRLPGSESIHLSEEEAELYEGITASINRNCGALIMLPGMDSFYLWTEQEPPTGYTATGWPTLFDAEHQRQVIDEISPLKNLCLLRNLPIAEGWGNGEVPPGPLVRYLEQGFGHVAGFDDYELLRQVDGAGSS
ncbi:MAG TPA: hypothetical protein VFU16_03575 [Solirubrobacterales bacterium]|nr:hypothetical protein [Solirubrobacterales bacterium]